MLKKKIQAMLPFWQYRRLLSEVEKSQMLSGNLLSRIVRENTYSDLKKSEFSVFSQFGEDGIIQYLLGKVRVSDPSFVEFGVESYAESNTRFLLMQENWRGYIIDGRDDHQTFLRESNLIWKHDIKAITAFITAENINDLFQQLGVPSQVGILSIDIDGNDYWVLEAIKTTTPSILIAEYNSLWGPELALTVPYDPTFVRSRAHHSNLYWGASLTALTLAAKKKGLVLVGCNSAGNNAFFVRQDLLGQLPALTPAEAYVEARYRESRDENQNLTLLSNKTEKLGAIESLPLFDVETDKVRKISELFKI